MKRPSFDEVSKAIELIKRSEQPQTRSTERFEVTIPGEIVVDEGEPILIRMHNISHAGMGFFHYGPIELRIVKVKLAVNTYQVDLKWCIQHDGDLYMSGGPILHEKTTLTQADPRI